MTPEQILGWLILALLLTVGAFALHRRRESWREPDCTPLGWRPTPEQAEIMRVQDISYLDAADMNAAGWAAARDAYYRARGL